MSHSRDPNTVWELSSGGVLSRGESLTLVAQQQVRAGEVLTIDYGPEQLDNQIALNYGVVDKGLIKVGCQLCQDICLRIKVILMSPSCYEYVTFCDVLSTTQAPCGQTPLRFTAQPHRGHLYYLHRGNCFTVCVNCLLKPVALCPVFHIRREVTC